MNNRDKSYRITLKIKDCDIDFSMGPGVLATQKATIFKADRYSRERIAAYLMDRGDDLMRDMLTVYFEEIKNESD